MEYTVTKSFLNFTDVCLSTERSITNTGIPILPDFLKLSRFFIVFEKFLFLVPFFFFLLNVKFYRKKNKKFAR